jgi:hypothetical protein
LNISDINNALLFICNTAVHRENIICNAQSDAVSVLETSSDSLTPSKRSSTQSVVDDDMATKVEETGFVESANDMSNVSVYTDTSSGDIVVTIVHTLVRGVTHSDCDVSFPPNANGGTTQQVIVTIPWAERYLDAKSVFWTPSNSTSGYEYKSEALAYTKSMEKSQRKKNMSQSKYTLSTYPFPCRLTLTP